MSDPETMNDQPNPMSPPTAMSQTGAIWCDEHGRLECSKRSQRNDDRCHAAAIKGTAACRNHIGIRTDLAKAQGEAVTAWSAAAGKPAINPADAVLGMLNMSWLRAHLYARLLQDQVSDTIDAEGLVLETTAATPGYGTYTSGEAIRALATLEAGERDRCVRYAKTAHDMGIAEKQIALAEQHGTMMAEVMRRILTALNLTPQQWEQVPDIVPRELQALGLLQ